MPKLIYSDKAHGQCSSCHKEISGNGYFILDSNGAVTGLVCASCKELEELTNEKKVSVTLKKLKVDFISALLGGELYQVESCKNIYFEDEFLTKQDVLKLVKNPNITVTLKY